MKKIHNYQQRIKEISFYIPKILYTSFAFLAAYCLVVPYFAFSQQREWEHWDEPNMAEIIDQYWTSSQAEIIHRTRLASLVNNVLLLQEHILEVGCGSGLVYEQLVPYIARNDCYVGIDNSNNMLSIARSRYPYGIFLHDDAYHLSMENNSFDVVVAFEVLGHLKTIEKPISEMFRVASRLVIFTTWVNDQTTIGKERLQNVDFIHTSFSHQDILETIERVIKEPHQVSIVELTKQNCAYLIYKL